MTHRPRLPRRLPCRAAKIAGVFGRRTARHTSTRFANLFRDAGRARELTERRHRETAAQLRVTLGGMRGGAAKLGQLASFLELDLVPAAYRELYRSELAALRDCAPPMDWAQVRRVLEEEWGAPPESILEDLAEAPAAAASLGQVHRATLPDRRAVAIKVQYPEVAEAFRRELRSVVRLLPLLRGVAPAVDSAALSAELSARGLEELDYEHEGAEQALFARAYRGHPFIHVPAVHCALTRRRVLVTEWSDGLRFAAVRELPADERDRFGEILFRFYLGAGAVLGRFNADPHPGNYLLRGDGSVAFVDFGSVKIMSPASAERFAALIRAGMTGDPSTVRDALAQIGFLRRPELVDPQLALRWLRLSSGWLLDDRRVTIDPDVVRRALPLPGNGSFGLARSLPEVDLPPDELLFGRMRTSLAAVLGQLRATANWCAIAREWLYGDTPSTELGRQEASYRPTSSTQPL